MYSSAAARAADAAGAGAAEAAEPIWASGKSFGGRMASMAVAEGMPAAGLVFLGYPLHPPGRPEKARDEHLPGVDVPMLFLQGRNDPFAIPNEQLDELVARLGPIATLEWIEDANHSFEVKGRKRPAAEIGASLAPRELREPHPGVDLVHHGMPSPHGAALRIPRLRPILPLPGSRRNGRVAASGHRAY